MVPRYACDVLKLEKVQNAMTKQVSGIGNKQPEQRDRICNLPSIEGRIKRVIAIETFEILNGMCLSTYYERAK